MADSDPTTKPTLETLLEMMRGVRDEMRAGFVVVNERFDAIETRLDRMDGMIHTTRGDVLDLRADFRELKAQLKEHLPALK